MLRNISGDNFLGLVADPDYFATYFAEIPLTQGRVALVDRADLHLLNKWTWQFHSGYAARSAVDRPGDERLMHRLIIQAEPGFEVDHINGDKLDNRRANLRQCTKRENSRNKPPTSLNTSGYKGVGRSGAKWRAYITLESGLQYLGTFPTPEDAALAYDASAREHFGEFAYLNFPLGPQ